jgi:predicted AAA+ superfamily ATPase
LRFSENIERIYENAVAIQLLRKYGKENIFYWKSQKEEVDFVVKEGQKVTQLIQVCYDIRNVEKREVGALLSASKELGCKNLLIITENYEAEKSVENKKIKFVPLWKWLLQ